MFAGAVLGGIASNDARGILYLAGFEVTATALVALVAAGVLATVRTGALDVAVGQRLVGLRVPRDLDLLFVDVAAFVEFADELLGEVDVGLLASMSIIVELDVELRERLLILLVVAERELLGA